MRWKPIKLATKLWPTNRDSRGSNFSTRSTRILFTREIKVKPTVLWYDQGIKWIQLWSRALALWNLLHLSIAMWYCNLPQAWLWPELPLSKDQRPLYYQVFTNQGLSLIKKGMVSRERAIFQILISVTCNKISSFSMRKRWKLERYSKNRRKENCHKCQARRMMTRK